LSYGPTPSGRVLQRAAAGSARSPHGGGRRRRIRGGVGHVVGHDDLGAGARMAAASTCPSSRVG
jgi:hypothetical protein